MTHNECVSRLPSDAHVQRQAMIYQFSHLTLTDKMSERAVFLLETIVVSLLRKKSRTRGNVSSTFVL